MTIKYLILKVLMLTIRVLPWKGQCLSFLGYVAGVFRFFLNFPRDKDWTAPFPQTFSKPIIDVLHYYTKQEQQNIWEEYYFEDQKFLKTQVEFNNLEALIGCSQSGSGCIVVSYHICPSIVPLVLYEQKVSLGIYADPIKNIEAIGKRCPSSLLSNKLRYILDDYHFFQAPLNNKSLLKHLLGGGSVLFYNDVPLDPNYGSMVDFLGKQVCFNLLPFVIAQRYQIPVFVAVLERLQTGKHQLSFMPLKGFSTAEEGLVEFTGIISSMITKDPSLWKFTPNFHNWQDGH